MPAPLRSSAFAPLGGAGIALGASLPQPAELHMIPHRRTTDSRRRSAPAATSLAACVLAAAVALPGQIRAQAGDGSPAYRLPTPPTAVYHLVDTLATSINMGGGDQNITLVSAMTLAASFEADAAGVRVVGEVRDFSASMASLMGSQDLAPSVNGAYEWILGPTGPIEIVALPEVGGPAGQSAWLSWLAQEMFPRFPDGQATAGESWADTLAWSDDSPVGTAETTVVYTYTLAGETVVDGRSMIRIDIAGEQQISGTVLTGGMSMEQTLEGASEGFALWDPERALLHTVELSREYSGSMQSPLGALPMKVTASTARRLAEASP